LSTEISNKLNEGKTDSLPTSGMKLCFYSAAAENGRFLQVSVYEKAFMPTASRDPLAMFNALASATPQTVVAPSATPQLHLPVTGIGDNALIANPGIHIAYDGYYIQIAIGDPSIAENQEILKKAGQLAVDNLKKLLGK
jgi:hypothetical protein